MKWFSQTLNQSDFQLTCFQHLAYEDPDLPLRFYVGEGDLTNFMKYSEPKVNDAILAAASELDEDARVEKVYEAQRVIMSEYAPMLNLHSPNQLRRGATSYVKGSITGRGSYGAFNRTTWLDDEVTPQRDVDRAGRARLCSDTRCAGFSWLADHPVRRVSLDRVRHAADASRAGSRRCDPAGTRARPKNRSSRSGRSSASTSRSTSST